MTEIVWKDPPATQHGGGAGTRQFVAALQERPGEWALYPTKLKAPSASIYKKNHPGTQWTTRRRPDGRYDAYARWIGGES